MKTKELRNKYCQENGYGSFNEYNENDYVLWLEDYIKELEDVKSLLNGVDVSLPTHKELLLKMDSLVEKNYSKQTEIEKANFRIGWQECFSWIALKNVYENG